MNKNTKKVKCIKEYESAHKVIFKLDGIYNFRYTPMKDYKFQVHGDYITVCLDLKTLKQHFEHYE